MKNLWIFLSVGLLMATCQNDDNVPLKDLDLLQYGIPLTIKAPEKAQVTRLGGMMNEVMIEDSSSYYNVYISTLPALVSDVAKIKAEALEAAKNDPFFTKLILEEKQGFIYELNIDSVVTYNFNYIIVQGGKQYKFEKVLTSLASKEEVEKMYEAVQKTK